jgi:hypothetical protein
MTYPMPEGEHLRRAVKWISQNLETPEHLPMHTLVDQAIFRFDLTPKDGEYLIAFFKEHKAHKSSCLTTG